MTKEKQAQNAEFIALLQVLTVNEIAARYAISVQEELLQSPACKPTRRWIKQLKIEARLLIARAERLYSDPRTLRLIQHSAALTAQSIGYGQTVLFYTIKQSYDTAGLNNTAFLAHIETGRLLADYAHLQVSKRKEELQEYIHSGREYQTFCKAVDILDAGDFLKLWEKIASVAYKGLAPDIRERDAEQVHLAIRALDARLTDTQLLADCVNQASQEVGMTEAS